MAVNRYNLPSQQPIMNTYAPLPFKELLLAGKSMQDQKDKIEEQRLELAGKEFQFLDADYDKAKAKRDYYDTELEKAAGLYGTDLRQAKAATEKLAREFRKDFSQFGEVGAMQGNYDAYQKWVEKEEAKLAKGDITQDQFEKVKASLYSNYKGIGDAEKGRYNQFKSEDIAKYQDYAEFFDKYGSSIKADVQAYASSRPDLQGYINDFSGTLEHMEPEEVDYILSKYVGGSDEMLNYIKQGLKYGYTSLDRVSSGKDAAVEKFSYRKEDKSASTKNDTTHWEKKKREEEALAAQPISITTKQNIHKDRLTETAAEEDSWTGQRTNVGLDVFDADIENLTEQKAKVTSELQDLRAQYESTTDPAAKNAIQKKAMSLQAQIGNIDGEIDKSTAYKESFIKGAFNVDDEYLKENGYNSAIEYYEDINEYEKALAGVEESKALMQEVYNELPESSVGTWYLNSEGELGMKYDKGAQTNMINLEKSKIQQTIENYNQKNEALVNLAIQKTSEIGQSLNLNEDYNPEEPISSYNRIKGEINNKKKAATDNSEFFINNRTYTTRQDIITPDQTKKNPVYQAINAYANQKGMGNFKKQNSLGEIVDYEPKGTKLVMDGMGTTMVNTRLQLSGNTFSPDKGMMPTFDLVDEKGNILESGIMLDPSNTSVNKELNKMYKANAKATIRDVYYEEDGKTYIDRVPDGDAVVGFFATSPKGTAFNNTWIEVNKALSELPTEYQTNENNEIALRYIQGVGKKDGYYIGVDNVNDNDYIIFDKGLSKEDIKAGNYSKNDFTPVTADDFLPTALDYSYDGLVNYLLK